MPVVIAVVLALLWVFALRRWYRQAPTPLESVEHQQRALDALQHAASRSRSGPPASATTTSTTSRPLQSISSARVGRPQRSLAPIAVALVGSLVLAGIGVAWWVGRDTTRKQSASAPTSTTRHATTSTTVPPSTATAPTLPPVAHATITSQTGNGIMFSVDRPSFTLTVAASAPCWVRAQDPSQNGSPLYEGTLRAGDSQPIQVNGSAVLRLGAANNVTLTLDGQPLSLPGQASNTLTLTLNGSTNGA
jgi:hypothetical protein